MENLWREFEKKGDIFSYLKYKRTNIENFDLKVSDVNGNGKSSRNSDKNI